MEKSNWKFWTNLRGWSYLYSVKNKGNYRSNAKINDYRTSSCKKKVQRHARYLIGQIKL